MQYAIYGNDIEICGGRARPQGPGASMKHQLHPYIYMSVCLDKSDSICFNGQAGQGKPSRR